jgi:DNA-binding HxlR family transcriptional regulator
VKNIKREVFKAEIRNIGKMTETSLTERGETLREILRNINTVLL